VTPASTRLTFPERLQQAVPLVIGGSGYREAARTTGASRRALARHLPGFGLTKSEAGQLSAATIRARRAGVAL